MDPMGGVDLNATPQDSVTTTLAEAAIPVTVLRCEPEQPGATTPDPDEQAMDVMGAEERTRLTEQLIQQFHQDVYRYAYWLTRCTEAAEDISQETFLRAFRGVHRLRDPKASKGWLMTIARNEFARWCRKGKTPAGQELETELADPECAVAHVDNHDWVKDGLNALAPDFRMVVLMYYFEQLSYAEIAEQLSIPIGTVMSRLSRGRQQLKQTLSSHT